MQTKLKVFIRDFKVMLRVGVYDHEKHAPQPVRVNVEMETSVDYTQANEDLARTVNYESVIETIRGLQNAEHILLIETVAHKISEACFVDPRVTAARVTIEKTSCWPEAEACGITVETRR